MSRFKEGDRVLWHHEEATKHAAGSILREDVAQSFGHGAHPDKVHGSVGVVSAEANDQGTWFEVDFDGEKRVLTADELVRVKGDE